MSEPLPDQSALDGDAASVDARTDPPAGSQIAIERFADGLTIQIPPGGLWRGTKGLFFFAVIWNGFLLFLTPCLVGAVLGNEGQKNADQAVWILPLILSIFWLVGIGILVGSINMAYRKAAIAVTGGTLMVIQTGIFGSKQRDWESGDVGAIRAGPSGMTVNDKPVLELQILDGGGSKFGLLAGRSDEELGWLARELAAALAVNDSQS